MSHDETLAVAGGYSDREKVLLYRTRAAQGVRTHLRRPADGSGFAEGHLIFIKGEANMKVINVLYRGLLASAIVLGTIGAAQADEILKAKLRPCVKDGTSFGDVGSCGKVWKLGSGEAKLEADGKIKVEVKGLVLNDASTGESNGTPDGVTDVVATVI